jgi:poly(3-hydroxybutyrate) depolymerase
MFNWFNGGVKAVIQEVNDISDLVTKLVNELAAARAQIEVLQSVVTKLSGGALTASTEIALLKAALLAAGVKIPGVVGEQPKTNEIVVVEVIQPK